MVTIKNKKACYKETAFGRFFCIICIESFPDYTVFILNYSRLLLSYITKITFTKMDVLAGIFLDSNTKIIKKIRTIDNTWGKNYGKMQHSFTSHGFNSGFRFCMIMAFDNSQFLTTKEGLLRCLLNGAKQCL